MIRKEHFKTPAGTAVLSAFFFGLLVHAFAFFNILQNHDNIATQPSGFGIGTVLGRWLLEIMGLFASKIGLDYNLSVINGFLYILLLSLTAGVVVILLGIRRRSSAILIGALFVAFPTVTATMLYRYTVIYYGISALLAVGAVWISRNVRHGWLICTIFIAASMGIYQSYIPLTIGLFVMLLIQSALKETSDIPALIRQGVLDCVSLLLGLALYALGLRICSSIFHTELLEYQGVSNMFAISLSDLPGLVFESFRQVCRLALQDYYGLSTRSVMRLFYLALGLASAGMTGYILLFKVKKWLTAAAVGVLMLLFPVAVNFVLIMCPNSWIYTLMVYSFVLVTCLPLMLLECMPEKAPKPIRSLLPKAVALVAAMQVFYFGYYANVNYSAQYYATRQIENYLTALVTQVRMEEGFTPDKEWALIGQIDDPLLDCRWEEEITYGGLGFTEYLMNQYSLGNWFQNYIGYNIPFAEEEVCRTLSQSPEVKAMPCWPSSGSIAIIDDTVVIKFQELNP